MTRDEIQLKNHECVTRDNASAQEGGGGLPFEKDGGASS